MKNLVLTNIGERLFQPTIGSTVNGSLFEPNDAFLADDLKSSIRNVIESNEPRVTLIDVLVSPQADEVSVNVTIIFALINNMQPQSLDIILRRVR